jgi:ABC-2 type transport system ATP-binding protein
VRLRFAEPAGLDTAMNLLVDASRDNDALALRVPNDGSLHSLKTLIDRLDGRVEVAELSVHTPDLDDVFLALTGPDKVSAR